MSAASLLLGLLPVLLFLAALMFMDSYKLVARGAVLRAIAIGCAVALASLAVNWLALDALGVDPVVLRRYVAPLIEESLKAIYVVILIRGGGVGFLVDAAIHGFAIGTGLALVENLYYAHMLGDQGLALWLVRGLGTAVMHGSTTAVVAIVAKDRCDRMESKSLVHFVPGLLIAVVVHATYNHLLLNPLATTALLLLTMPLLLLVVFERSERATRDWLGTSLDNDVELLELIASGGIAHSHVGRYLESLKERFAGAVVADMLCLLQIHAELSIRAKGLLIARAAGVDLPVDPRVAANFEEMKFLRKSIGPTGQIAILPFMRTSDRDLWQMMVLRRKGGGPAVA